MRRDPTGCPTTARYAFVRADGSRTHVVLRVLVAGKARWYLMRYGWRPFPAPGAAASR